LLNNTAELAVAVILAVSRPSTSRSSSMATDLEPKALVRRYSEKVAADFDARRGSLTTVKRVVADDAKARQQEEADARKYFESWDQNTDK
jgi:hypothetical protein